MCHGKECSLPLTPIFGHGNIVKYCARNIFLSELDKKALETNGGIWHNGDWKGEGSSNWRISKETVEYMNDKLIENINNIVGKDDTLYHLGDWCFAPKHECYKVARTYRDRINCKTIYFIWGNHDSFQIRDLFDGCYDILNVNVNNQRIVLCHYAFAIWDKSHRGAWQLYGHSHSNAEEWLNSVMPNRRSIDVGVDNAAKILGDYRPFSFEELQNIIGIKPGFSADHHKIRSGPTEEELIG